MIDRLMAPLDLAVSWLLVTWHSALSTVLNPAAGSTWLLSIVGLVIVIRIVLIPLFVKQVKAQRGLQLIQPQMKELQRKYAGDRERLGQETMKLYRETGTNPLASCLPILLQAPIFFALFRVLQYGIAQEKPIGVFGDQQALLNQAHDATFLGVPLWGYFNGAAMTDAPGATRALTMVMVILMSATTFLTQRQLMVKNMAADNPMARQQKMLLYVFPVIFLISGIYFPVGVLMYWLTTNLWSMGQQFWIIRNNPTPDTPAYAAWEARKRAKQRRAAIRRGEISADAVTIETAPALRQQPKRASRAKRSGAGDVPAIQVAAPAAAVPMDEHSEPHSNGDGTSTVNGTGVAPMPPAGDPSPAKGQAAQGAAGQGAAGQGKKKRTTAAGTSGGGGASAGKQGTGNRNAGKGGAGKRAGSQSNGSRPGGAASTSAKSGVSRSGGGQGGSKQGPRKPGSSSGGARGVG